MSESDILLTIIYAIIGLLSISVAIHALRSPEQEARYGIAAFWIILGITFIFGDWIPSNVVGILIIIMAILSASKQVKVGKFTTSTEAFKLESAKKIGNKLFVPALVLAGLAFVIAQYTPLGSFNAIGLSGMGALIVMLVFAKSNVSEANQESTCLLRQVGPMAANFNMVPASILDLKNRYGVIKAQAPVAIAMLMVHIFLMRFLAF